MTAGASPAASMLRIEMPGPVGEAYFRDRSPVSCIMGPVGSAKTTLSLQKAILTAYRQRPSTIDGVRRVKCGVIRDTYPNLRKTALATWHAICPPSMGKWSGEAPYTHTVQFDTPGGRVELTMEFIALGEHRVEDVMRGWEGTCAYLNEADRLSEDVLTYVKSRVAPPRYPSPLHGGASWGGVWLDCNAPDTGNWIYQRFVKKPVEGERFYRQPSGLSPQAENMKNLRKQHPDYYGEAAKGQPDWFVRRMIRNEFGYSREGQPVYLKEFADAKHFAAFELLPAPGLPLLIGADADLKGAFVIAQRMPQNGAWRFLDEVLAPPEGMGARRLAEALNRLLATPKYRNHKIGGGWRAVNEEAPACIWADPASGFARTRTDEQTWAQIVFNVTGIRVRPAPGNNNTMLRIEALRHVLDAPDDGDQPNVLFSPTMIGTREGLNSEYKFRVRHDGTTEDKPEKNIHAAVIEAAQYVCLGNGEYDAVMGRKRAGSGPRQTQAIDEDNPRPVYSGGGARQTRALD